MVILYTYTLGVMINRYIVVVALYNRWWRRQQVLCMRPKDVFAAGIHPRVDNYLTAVLHVSTVIILYITCARATPALVRGKYNIKIYKRISGLLHPWKGPSAVLIYTLLQVQVVAAAAVSGLQRMMSWNDVRFSKKRLPNTYTRVPLYYIRYRIILRVREGYTARLQAFHFFFFASLSQPLRYYYARKL